MRGTENEIFDTYQLLPTKTALIVVDVQNDFCHDEGIFSKNKKVDLDHVQQAVTTLLSFIEICHQFNLPTIFVRTIHSAWTDSPSWLGRMRGAAEKMRICPPGSWGADFYKVTPTEADCVISKHRYSAFVGTDLDLILRSGGIENILLAGVVTNVCVETTARDGFNLNYNVIMVEDCCGAYDHGEHAATLNNISKYFGRVATCRTLIEILEKQKKSKSG